MKPLRLAILSATGTAQKRTIPALVNSKLVTVSAIQGRNPQKLRDVSDRYGIQSIFTDEHKLLDEGSYDAVMICSPPYMHFSQAKRVIDRGTPCLLEKPAAMSADECNELRHIAARRAVVVHVAHHLRRGALGAVGLGQFDIEERRDRSPWVLGVIVRRDRRGAGIGRLLLAHLERWAHRQGYEQLWVATGGAAVGFYRRCGWRIYETVDRDFEPATVLTKEPRAEPMWCIPMPVQGRLSAQCG